MESVFYFLSGILSILYFVHIPWFLSHFCSYRKMHTWKQHFFAFLLLCFFMFFPVNQIFYTETSSLLWIISFLFQILFYFFSFFITAYFIYKNTLFLSIVAVTLLFFSQILSTIFTLFLYYLFSNFFITTELLSSSLRTILLNLFTIIFLHSFVYFSNKYPLRFKKNKKGNLFIILIILTIVVFFLLFPVTGYLMSNTELSLKSHLRIILIGSILFIDIIFLPFTLKLIQQLHLKSILDTMQEEVEKELEYYHTLENQLIKMRKIRHDFNNQLQTAYMLLDDPNMEIASFPDSSELSSPPQFCENKILDFILQDAYSYAKKLRISFNFNVSIPEAIEIESIDLCSIFSNLLNNAVHAAQKTENPTISLNASYSNSELNVEISNTTLEKDIEYRDPKFHGYGLLILNDLAEKYNGTFSTMKKGTIFYAYFHASI